MDSDCSHEIKGSLLLGRKPMTNLESTLKSRMGERKWTRGDILVKEVDEDTANEEVLKITWEIYT